MDEKSLEALLEQAIVDCYDEEEEFSGVLCTLDDNLNFPLQAADGGVPLIAFQMPLGYNPLKLMWRQQVCLPGQCQAFRPPGGSPSL